MSLWARRIRIHCIEIVRLGGTLKKKMTKRVRQTNFSRKALCSGTIEVEVIGNDSYVAKQFGQTDAVFEKDASSIDFALYFRPALTRAEAERAHVNVFYTGKWTTPNNHLFGKSVLPHSEKGDGDEILLGEELRYTVHPTHQLKWSRNGQMIEAIYWTIENNLVTHNTQNTLLLELHIEDKPFLKSVFGPRVHHLSWFPPDIEPAAHGLAIDSRNIPQRTALWFKLRGPVSGTKAYTLLGFYVPRKDEPGGASYSFFKPEAFSAFSRVAMRLGSISEDAALLLYLSHNTNHIMHEIGWCPAPAGYPVGWGASPDGRLVDPNMTWDQVPPDIREHYQKQDDFDITQGVLEIKTTRSEPDMKAYHVIQVYMEMIALKALWAHVLRFRPSRVYDAERKIHTVQHTACVYRIWRHKPTEEMLMKLWTHAYANASKLQDVVHTEEAYIKARAHFEQMAANTPVYKVLDMTPQIEQRFLEMERKRQEHTKVSLGPQEESEVEAEQRLLREISQRAAAIGQMDYKRHKGDFVKLVSDQIGAHADLLHQLF